MERRRGIGIALILMLAVLAACGQDGRGGSSPKAIDGVLLRASDLPDMRLIGEDPAKDATDFVEILGSDGSCLCPSVFKDLPDVGGAKLSGFGFKRGYAERWGGAGVHGAAFAVEFDTADHAAAALEYMKAELFRECPDSPYCSRQVEVEKSGIPDLVGEAVTPLRPAAEGRQATLFKFVFRVDTAIYGVMDGADSAYDPATVTEDEALAVLQRFYDRVKGRSISSVLSSAPTSPRGPGAAPHQN